MGFLFDVNELDAARVGQDLHRLAVELYPICRSITGDGIRQTLNRSKRGFR